VEADTPCVSLFVVDEVEVAPEQASETIAVPKRGWYQWCDGAALAVGNLIVNGIRYFFIVMKFLNSERGYDFENIWKRS
jgi:hypothetical protein